MLGDVNAVGYASQGRVCGPCTVVVTMLTWAMIFEGYVCSGAAGERFGGIWVSLCVLVGIRVVLQSYVSRSGLVGSNVSE